MKYSGDSLKDLHIEKYRLLDRIKYLKEDLHEGSGLGLVICEMNLEELNRELKSRTCLVNN